MKKMNAILALAGVSFLGACAEGIEITTPTNTLDIKSQLVRDRVIRMEDKNIRTFTASSEGNSKVEVSGATCKLSSFEMSGTFVTPARVQFPVFKGKPSRVNIDCTSGNLAGDTSFDATLVGGGTTGYSGNILVDIAVGAISQGVAESRDEWEFIPFGTRVTLE